jgi:hypothetical protein
LLLGLAALLFAANVIAQQTTAQALAAWEAQGVRMAWRDRISNARISCRRWAGSLRDWNTAAAARTTRPASNPCRPTTAFQVPRQ